MNSKSNSGPLEECKKSLKSLQLEQVDMYLVHCPSGVKLNGVYSKHPNQFVWEQMEECYRKEYAKCIGISNYNCQSIVGTPIHFSRLAQLLRGPPRCQPDRKPPLQPEAEAVQVLPSGKHRNRGLLARGEGSFRPEGQGPRRGAADPGAKYSQC